MNNIGAKYFRADFDESSVQDSVIRVIDYDDFDKLFKVVDKDNKTFKITQEELSKYTKLNPDGLLMASYVKYDGLDDVLITFHKIENRKIREVPSIVCRQNIIDVFAMMQGKNNRVGLCVSDQTCPEGIRFEDILAYDTLEDSSVVYTYMEDTLDDLLLVLGHKKADKILRNLKQTYDQRIKEEKESAGSYKIHGICETLEELMSTNDFMTEYHRIFEVLEVPFSLKWEEKLPKRALIDIIAEHEHKVPHKFYVFPYNRSIDTNTFYKNWLFMTADPKKADKDDRAIYIVGYDIDYKTSFAQFKYGSTENMMNQFQQLGFS